MIRTGRPAFHIKACSISFIASNGDIELYQLDSKGNLVKSPDGKKIIPHIIKSHAQAAPILYPATNKKQQQKKEEQQKLESLNLNNSIIEDTFSIDFDPSDFFENDDSEIFNSNEIEQLI